MAETSNIAAWKQELALLLNKMQSQPSADLGATRDRIVVLNHLIAGAKSPVPA